MGFKAFINVEVDDKGKTSTNLYLPPVGMLEQLKILAFFQAIVESQVAMMSKALEMTPMEIQTDFHELLVAMRDSLEEQERAGTAESFGGQIETELRKLLDLSETILLDKHGNDWAVVGTYHGGTRFGFALSTLDDVDKGKVLAYCSGFESEGSLVVEQDTKDAKIWKRVKQA